MSQFLNAYITCALWSSTDISEEGSIGLPLDDNYSVEDIAPETLEKMKEDCEDFQSSRVYDLFDKNVGILTNGLLSPEKAGHDFWLSRNGHGAGYFDEGLGEIGDRLQKAAKEYGEVNLYIGDDGKIHCS